MVYFGFNSISGRVSQGTAATYMPQGLKLPAAEGSGFQFDTALTKKVPVPGASSGAGAHVGDSGRGVVPKHPGYQRVRALQTAFAAQDGLLVWQKRGVRDMAPMWATFGLMVAGMAIFARNVYIMSYPPAPEQ